MVGDSMKNSKQHFVSDRYVSGVFLTDFQHSFFLWNINEGGSLQILKVESAIEIHWIGGKSPPKEY